MREIHCKDCGRFLLKAEFAHIEIKCNNSRCKAVNTVKLVNSKILLTSREADPIIKA